MKTFILLALVACSLAAPAPLAVDYSKVTEKVVELQELVRSSLLSVVTAASADKPTVGSQIETIAGAAADKARATLEEAQALIDAETLTHAQAEVYLKGLEALLVQTQADVRPLVGELSQSTQTFIFQTFETAYKGAQAIAEEIYALLDAKRHAPNYAEVSKKVAEIQELVASTFQIIITAAKEDNPTIGSSIEVVAVEALEQAKKILAEAQGFIDAQTLSVPQAKNYFGQLEALLLKTQADVKPDVDQLKQETQDMIRITFEISYVQAQTIAEEVYALLV